MNAITRSDDEILFDRTMQSLEAQITSAGAHLTIDSKARLTYTIEIKRMSNRLRADAVARRITWADAARQAQETRNLIMEVIRARSTPVGRALAQRMKQKGYSLNQLVAEKTIRMHGDKALFSSLSNTQQNAIYASIVKSAGNSNAEVTRAMTRISYAGRGVLFLALALSIYQIATAENKVVAFKKELAINGAGVAGGIAGGALAGLACGPASPICVTVGAFVGGAFAALGQAISGRAAMKLIPAAEYSIRVITPPTPELTPQSEIMVAGVPTGKVVAGAILRAALRWGQFVLLFLTDDVPFEDTLRMYLLDQDLTVVDSARMGAMYSTGIFSALDLTEPDTVRFQFFDGVLWTLTLLSEEEFAIPIISEPTSVSRPFKFFRRIRLAGKPLPKTSEVQCENVRGSTN